MRSLAAFLVAAIVISTASSSVLKNFPVQDDGDDDLANNTLIYQIDVGSWKDSDGDGWGDFDGIASSMDYFKDLGVSTLLISPIYNETDWKEINQNFGSLSSFKNMVKAFRDEGFQVYLDIEPTATSVNHQWFQAALQNRSSDYFKYYIWMSEKTPTSKTNWVPILGGNEGAVWMQPNDGKMANDFYLQFFDGPELDYTNEKVVNDVQSVFKEWAGDEYNITGFRIRHASYLIEANFTNERKIENCTSTNNYDCYLHSITTNTEETYKVLQTMVSSISPPKKILVEPYVQNDYSQGMKYCDSISSGCDIISPVLTNFTMATTSTIMKSVIEKWMNADENTLWMCGNRDTSRLATRMGPDGQDGLSILSFLLPGSYVMYYGDEIGMSDMDGFAINGDQPAQRTGYQWDSGLNGGFSNSSYPQPLVNPNYWRINYNNQKDDDKSRYSLAKSLLKIKQNLKSGYNFSIPDLVNNLTLTFLRESESTVFLGIMNTDNMDETYNLTYLFPNRSSSMGVDAASLNSEYKKGDTINLSNFTMRPMSAIILSTGGINSSVIAQFSVSLILMCLAFLRLNF